MQIAVALSQPPNRNVSAPAAHMVDANDEGVYHGPDDRILDQLLPTQKGVRVVGRNILRSGNVRRFRGCVAAKPSCKLPGSLLAANQPPGKVQTITEVLRTGQQTVTLNQRWVCPRIALCKPVPAVTRKDKETSSAAGEAPHVGFGLQPGARTVHQKQPVHRTAPSASPRSKIRPSVPRRAGVLAKST